MPGLQKSDRIFIAGHRGLVGNALLETLQKQGYKNLLVRTHAELDLENYAAVEKFYRQETPDVVFVAAAKVGGIHANNTYRYDFIYKNLQIQNNVIGLAHQYNVRRLIFLGSSCVYPKNAPQPMPETCLLSNELEYTNRPYALAKIAGLELIESLRRQHGRDYFSVMPTNLYGPRDNFDPLNSHVVSALIRRFYEAKQTAAANIVVWGTGKPLRELLFATDCAEAIVFLAEKLDNETFKQSPIAQKGWSHINIGSGSEISIANLAALISKLIGCKSTVDWDNSKPDGVARKLLDSSFLQLLGWRPQTSLENGLKATIDWFEKNH
jgi:GDP-L-fucose synthase